jgi:hypothetical protein
VIVSSGPGRAVRARRIRVPARTWGNRSIGAAQPGATPSSDKRRIAGREVFRALATIRSHGDRPWGRCGGSDPPMRLPVAATTQSSAVAKQSNGHDRSLLPHGVADLDEGTTEPHPTAQPMQAACSSMLP